MQKPPCTSGIIRRPLPPFSRRAGRPKLAKRPADLPAVFPVIFPVPASNFPAPGRFGTRPGLPWASGVRKFRARGPGWGSGFAPRAAPKCKPRPVFCVRRPACGPGKPPPGRTAGFPLFLGAGLGAAFGKTARPDAGDFSAPWGRWGRAFLPAGAFGRPFNSFSPMFRLSLPLKNGLFVLCLIVLVVVTVVGAGDVVENSLSRRCGADFPGPSSWGSSCGRLVERAGSVIFSTQDVQNGS